MLYVTTRDKTDVFTSNHALREQRGSCGGLYVPYRLPRLTVEVISELASIPFGQRVAQILNLFYNADITGWDVEFVAGRRPVRVAAMPHKIAVFESWHNHGGDIEALIKNLYSCFGKDDEDLSAGEWFRISVRIAVLFGVFADLLKTGVADMAHPLDIAVAVNNFEAPMAAWYARRMGLPIGTVICCCNENSGLWDLFHHGELQSGAKVTLTDTPCSDVAVPAGLERLVFEVLGFDEAQRFVQICSEGRLYSLGEEKVLQLKQGFYCAVVRQQRVASVIRNVYKTNSYLMDPYTALAYGGLQDYRVTNSETGPALIQSDRGPIAASAVIAKILNIHETEVMELIDTH